MEIGKPQKIIEVQPVEEPFHREQPAKTPRRETTPTRTPERVPEKV